MKVRGAGARTGERQGVNARLVRGAVLGAWSAFFAYLQVSGEMARFLGPRTYWVVPFGAIALGLASVVHFATLRSAPRKGPARGDLVGVFVLLVPILAVAAVPRPDLGALAASRKSIGGVAPGFVAPPAEAGRELSFIEVHYANESDEYAASLGIADGTPIDLLGFVSEEAGSNGTFELSRFYVSCCAADAIPYSVTVQPARAAGWPINTWLEVSGGLTETGNGWILTASEIERVDEPKNPYLY